MAQTSDAAIVLDIENDTLRPGQSTTVTLSAAWPEHEFAMGYVWTSLETSVGSVGWSGLELVAPMDGPGTTPGARSTAGIDGIVAGQLNYCPASPYCPTMDNPIAFWRATYTAPVDVGAGFDVDLRTRTTGFEVYFAERVLETHGYLDELVEGQATIHVVPAPASALVLIGVACSGRRRR
ncbi:MAG: hypothetical protein ACIAS6_13130 [Phycisphaerales bacterium JB060]